MIETIASRSPVQVAFTQAKAAQLHWAATPLRERLACIRRVRHLLAERCVRVGEAIGGRLGESLVAEVLPLADAGRFLERNATKLLAPETLGRASRPVWLRDVRSRIVREPFGVVLIIAPTNYPLFIPGVQLFQALVSGNAVLLKPGAGGAAAALMLRELCRDAGIDERLVAVLPDSEAAGREALELPVDKVFFTGSPGVGKNVLARLAPRVIPSVVELSGCDAAIIRADADLRLAVRALAFGLEFKKSATCIAPRRVLVPRGCLEQLEAALAAHIHPRVHVTHDPRLSEWLHAAVAAGATTLIGGFDACGRLHLPCVLTDVRADTPFPHLDTFAPVFWLITVENEEQAIALANDCRCALGATIFSRDENAARALASRLDAGIVVINDVIVPTADPRVPFGGRKQSGFGVTRGAEGLLATTRPKVIQVRRGRRPWHLNTELAARSSALFAAFIQLSHGTGIGKRLEAFGRLLAQMKKAVGL